MRILTPLIVLATIIIPIFITTDHVIGNDTEKPFIGAPTITFVIDQEMVEVSVEPGSDGIGRFSGTVYCEMPPSTPPGQSCIVQLNADAGGWPVQTPESMTFDRSHVEEDFAVSVQVPIETSQYTSAQLSISGRWSYSPGATAGTIPATTAIIRVLSYSQPIVTAKARDDTIPVGTWGDVTIEVTNAGNANDDIQLQVTDVPDGVSAYFEEDTITVPEKDTKTVILKVKQSGGPPGSHQLTVIAKGRNNGTKDQDQQTVVFETGISVKSLATTSYMIIPFLIILIAGGVLTYISIKRMKRKRAMVKDMS